MENQNTVIGYAQQILTQTRKAVVGKDDVLLWVLAAVLAGGHILMEDIPGVGKTTMALAFSKALGLAHNRMQFTPDVLPSDVTGYSILEQGTGAMVYRPGAVLCNLFLADELNRATSRTQSALLEAMEEGQVTVDGVTHPLPQPFVVIATQNPTGAAGTQLLPDSQMDRFFIRVSLGYPERKDEIAMIRDRQGGNPLVQIEPVITALQLQQMRVAVANTYISENIMEYVVNLIHATRTDEKLTRGASPRATLAVIAMAKAVAQLRGRDYVVPKDVQEVLLPTLSHRLQLSHVAQNENLTAEDVLRQILGTVRAPKLR
ncbi:MAG: MoxR family ATPase [Oscillospiraceae bacterium]|nr:MoxR family ATPase [Oscillospiraceae bacterium]